MSKPTLQELYYDPSIGLSNAKAFYQKVKHLGYTMNDTHKFLNKQSTYQINKGGKQFNYIQIRANEINEQWQIDLADMNKIKRYNHGYGWLMVVIDVYSRYAYAVPLKTKTEKEVAGGLRNIIENVAKTYPQNIITDQGKEFINKAMKKLLNEYGIKQQIGHLNDKHRTAIAERFIRTMRNLITKYQTATDSLNWVDVLDKLLSNYNSNLHHGINAIPQEVEEGAATNQQQQQPINTPHVGDIVRVLNESNIFTKKSAAEKWSSNLYKIEGRNGYSFSVSHDGKPLKTTYRPYQLMVVKEVEKHNTNEREKQKEEILKEQRYTRGIRREGVDESNIIQGKRVRKQRVL